MNPKSILVAVVTIAALVFFGVLAVCETLLRGKSVLSDCGLDRED